ncbi:MAG: DUF3042 family protein [Streptococcaceae bacterium]|jgi:hypothetical protein|nr:DUF3042 family protein [Streptococcaceae bacterium]
MIKIPKNFTTGFIAGASAALAAVASGLITFKVVKVDPAKRYDEWLDTNKKLANRKSTRH